MINTLTFTESGMRAAYVRNNGIKSAFVTREDRGRWHVYEGNAETLCGFLAGEFKTRREAIALRDAINSAIGN